MSKVKFKTTDSYSPAEAEALITAFLDNLARSEVAVARWGQILFRTIAIGGATCDMILRYNVSAAETHRRAVGALVAIKRALGQIANDQKYAADTRRVAAHLSMQLNHPPREPVFFGTGRDPATGKITFQCQSPNEPVDPRNIRSFGELYPSDCQKADNGGQGIVLQGLPIAVCAAGPIAATSCALAAITAVALVKIGLGGFIGVLKEVRLLFRGDSDVEVDRLDLETSVKRAEVYENCVTQELFKAGTGITFQQRSLITAACAKRAKALVPDRGRRPSFWLAVIPVVAIGATVGITWMVLKKQKSESKVLTARKRYA